MDRSWGTVRTARGELIVEQDALHLHTSPRQYVAGQVARFRKGSRGQRLRALGAVLLLLLFPIFLAQRLLNAADAGASLALLLATLYVGATTLQFWGRYGRDTRIPRSAIEDLTVDPDERELVVEHTHDPGRLPSLRLTSAPRETTLRLPSSDEVQKARTLLRSVRIADDVELSDGRTVTEYQVETRNGVVFCEACDSQVSPTDDRCPACDTRLRVERVPETA